MSNVDPNEHIEKVTYAPGDFIFFEGDLESHFFIVESGTVQIFTKTKDGKRVNICDIREGETFGEFALLDNQPRSASAQALTVVSAVKVSAQGYEELLNDLPVWAMSMLKSFADRLKGMTQSLKG
ncbi:MAG: Crp/Fnr family transcriptional regulator [Bdellovibrionia bacterium]